MHQTRHFAAPDRAAMLELIDAFPLAALVVADGDGFEASPLPLLAMDGDGESLVLRGHVARANPLAQLAAEARPALAMFTAEQHYVSPGWYPSKQEHGRVVPTWNYRVVHAHGHVRAIEDAAWLRALVGALTARQEGAQVRPWRVEDAPDDYVAGMLRGIVGIEIAVDRLEGKWKLSQNRSPADRAGVVAGLRALDTAHAEAMAACIATDDR